MKVRVVMSPSNASSNSLPAAVRPGPGSTIPLTMLISVSVGWIGGGSAVTMTVTSRSGSSGSLLEIVRIASKSAKSLPLSNARSMKPFSRGASVAGNCTLENASVWAPPVISTAEISRSCS